MRRWGHIALCSATALFAFVLAAAPLSAAPAYVPGEVIVKFRPGASAAAIAAIRADLGGTVKRELALTGAVCLKLTGLEVEEAVAKYRGDPAIEYLEPNYLWQADVIPNDARFGELWGLHNLGQSGGTADADVDAPEAWDSETGSSDVIVAVIDTGVDYAHPDLAANRWVNTGEMAGNGVDDDHNGFIDDVHGYDFVNNDGNPMDDHSHGTHCAGTIGAVGNNGIGVAGVCWQVRIMAVKFLDAGGGGTTDAAIASVEYAVQMGADILSNSWGGGGYSEALRDAIVAAETAGILFVAAAGNSASNNDTYPHYPASYDVGNIVSVAATDRNDALADFSCWGPLSVDLAAPGVDVFSTMPSAYYDYKSGTSMACPHVSGALALIKARFPGISGASARTLLLNTVNAVPGLAGVVATGGRLNVAAVMAGPDTIPPAPIPDLAATAVSGQWADLAWTATGDDGSTGTAAAYELRFATFPIDSLNFASATLATGLPAPRAAGAAESHRVRGLAFGTDYWFAIRARDEYGLPSPVVSAAMATTAPPPAITAPTDTLAAVLYPGGSTTRVLTIGNTGQSDLVWSAAVEAVDVLIARARGARFTTQDFPHTSPTLPAPGANGTAAAPPPFAKRVYSRELKVVTGPQVLLLVTVDPLNNAYGTALQNLGLEHTLVTSWSGLEAELASATWDLVIIDSYNFWTTSGGLDQLVAHLDQGGALIYADWSVYTYTTSPLLSRLGVSFQSDLTIPLDLAAVDPSHRCFRTPNDVDNLQWNLDQLNRDGQIVGVLDGAQRLAAFVGHPTSGAIVLNDTGHGLFNAFQSANFIADDDGDGRVDVVELAENEIALVGLGASWLSVEPAEGVLAAGDSQDLTVTIDATDLCGGEYAANLILASNDPLVPELAVPATLDVLGESDITVLPADFAFGTRFLGATVIDTLIVANDGCELLTVDSVLSDHAEFSVTSAGPFTLEPGARQLVVVTYSVVTLGDVAGTVTIASDDPDEPVIEVALSGTGVKPPVITVTPDSLTAELYPGGVVAQTLTIGNVGHSDLFWSATMVAGGSRQLYRLPPLSGSPARSPEAGAPTLVPSAERKLTELTAELSDLTGVRIVWDRAHGQLPPESYYSWIVAELEARGAVVAVNLEPFTSTSLASADIVWTLDAWYAFTPAELSALTAWLHGGGGLLLEGDETPTSFNALLAAAGAGITYGGSVSSEITTAIHPHVTTVGIDELLLASPLSGLSAVVAPAGLLAQDMYGRSALAWSEVAGGRVVALCDELFEDYAITYADNRLFGHQVIDWLAGTGWLQLKPAEGVVAAGASQDVTVTFDASNRCGGALAAGIAVASNDPLTPAVTVPAALDVLGESDITVSPTSLAFGARFLGAVVTDTLTVANDGCELLTIDGVTSDHAEFSVAPAGPFTLAPAARQRIVVTYAPATVGAVSGTLTVASDDPDEPVIAVVLTGTGVKPPVITVTPDTLAVALAPGGATTRTLTIGNTGYSDLVWSAAVVASGARKPYRLPPPPASPARVPEAGSPVSTLPAERTLKELAVDLRDLTGVRILWDQAHGQVEPWGCYSTLVADLQARGAEVFVNLAPFTPESLAAVDIVWTLEMYNPVAPPEVSALAAWLLGGGGLLLEGDQSNTSFNSLLAAAGAGITYGGDAASGTTTAIHTHETTVGIDELLLGGPMTGLSAVVAPAGLLAQDAYGQPALAWSQVLGGRVVALCDELFEDYVISYLDNRLFGNQVFDWLAGPNWLQLDPAAGVVAAGATQDVLATFDAADLCGGALAAGLAVASNDPLRPVVTVPAALDVLGESDIAVSPTSLAFGAHFLGAVVTDTLTVANDGCELLTIAGVKSDHAEFSALPAGPFTLAPDASLVVVVTYAPVTGGAVSGTLAVASDDPDEPFIAIALTGTGVKPPVITVAPDTLAVALAPGGATTRTLTIGNTGHSDLIWTVAAVDTSEWRVVDQSPVFRGAATDPTHGKHLPGSAADAITDGLRETYQATGPKASSAPRAPTSQSRADLAEILANLDAGFGAVTGLIPSRFDFTDGVTGTSISDGGNDMYDGGNVLSTNLGGSIPYRDGLITNSAVFGAGGRYFTRKYPGLFALVADVEGIARFEINGNLGADGYGSADGAVLETTVGGRRYLGFVKRVFGAGNPSVNHLVIVAADAAAAHAFATNTNDDWHQVTGLGGQSQIYYLLYAAANGGYINNPTTLLIMEAFLTGIGLEPDWLRFEPQSGTTAAGATQELTVTFDAAAFCGGEAAAAIIVSSNDPLRPQTGVLAMLDVLGEADIAVSPTSLDFGARFIGATRTDTLLVANLGCEQLTVSGVTSDQVAFSATPAGPFTLAPDSTRTVLVTFAPTTAGVVTAQLTFAGDDPDEPTVVVALAGTGLEPPVITVAPDTLAVALAPGETATRTLAIGNAGASELWWSAVAVADHPRKLFRLPPLAPSPSPSPEAGASAAPPPGVHASTELTAELRDLTGVQILWDRAHGQLPPRNHHGAMLAELAARGAEVNESHAPLTVDLLGSCDILWLFETTLPFTTEERSAVATWLHDGGSLLLEGDGSPSPFNALLAAAGAGIVYGNGAQAGITTIYPHATTVGVDSLYLSGPWSGLSAVLAPAGILARSSDGQAAMAWSEVGAGRIVAFCDEVLVDYAITVADNRLFGNQVIDWLATPGWLRLEPTMGVVAAGASQDVTVTFNAASRCGDFAARITVTSNDPVNPTLAVAARMDVAGAPDIDVAPTRLAFGSHYTGTATTAALVVANDGCAPLTVSGVTSDQAAFTVVPAGPFTVPRDSTRSVAVTFAPATAGGISGQLTIASDDPDEPALVVPLSGTGVEPPAIMVFPDSLAMTLAPGGAAIRTLVIGNTGRSDLHWSASINLESGRRLQTLPARPGFATGEQAADLPPPPQAPLASPELVAGLLDLTGVRIMWDASHTQGLPGNWSEMVADLENRGAEVIINSLQVTPATLQGIHVFWSIRSTRVWYSSEVAALVAWVRSGGGLLLEGDSDAAVTAFNTILQAAGAGIFLGVDSAVRGLTSAITPHATTSGVTGIYLNSPFARLTSVHAPGLALVRDNMGTPVAACSEVGDGRVVAASDELFGVWGFSLANNRLFGNQVFDWLAGSEWLRVHPISGVVPPGFYGAVEVAFSAPDQRSGVFSAMIAVASDDPVTPTVPVPIRLTIDDGTGPPAVTIVANLGAGQSEVLTAGSVTGATDGYDEDHDLLAAAPGGSPVTAWFPRAEWLVPGGDRFRTDLRAPYDDSISYKSWRFAVAAAEAGQVELTFAPDPADASETGRHLVDRSTGQIHDLRASATYTYAAGAAEVREFTLRLGDGLPAQDPGDREITATWSMVGASLSPPAGATLQDVILSQAPVASWLFRWEPTAANYIILPGTSPCLQGQGIWLYAPQRFAWEMSGSPNTAEIHVPLARGWTMVGYPLWFRGDLSGTVIEHAGVRYSFTDAVARGLVAGMMFDFDDRGYYRATTELVPWHGYWAASYADDVTLHFHHEWMEDPQLLPSPRAPSVKRLPTDWTTTVRIDGAGDGIVLGRSGRATDGFDAAWDLPAPPPSPLPAASATISLPRPEWAPAITESFLSDVRAAGEQPLVFPARVTAAAAGVVCLSWERGELPDGVDLEIRSGGRTLVASMRAVGSVEVAVGETPLDLQFATTNGLPEAAWLIEGLRLRNQPNPFNPSTDFRFNLAAGGDTRLLIYDARGTLVQEIEAGQLPAGPAQLTWNGVDRRGQVVASGVYLYRLIQDGRQLGGTRKMVLLK